MSTSRRGFLGGVLGLLGSAAVSKATEAAIPIPEEVVLPTEPKVIPDTGVWTTGGWLSCSGDIPRINLGDRNE